MDFKENLILTAEHDYCQWVLNEKVKHLHLKTDLASSTINQMVDKATGFENVDYREVAMVVYWCEEVIKRRKKLDITIETLVTMKETFIEFLKKCGKFDQIKSAFDEMDKQ